MCKSLDTIYGGLLFYAPRSNDWGHIVFALSVVNFNRLHIWHAYSTNDALSNDTKVNDFVTLTLIFMLKITF